MTKVTVYSTPNCAYCQMVKKFFEDNSIEFTEYDVSDDKEKAREMVHKSGQMKVPVIVIEKEGKKEIVIGFEQAILSQILGIK